MYKKIQFYSIICKGQLQLAHGRSTKPLSLSFEDVDMSFAPKVNLLQVEVVLFESKGISSTEKSS